MHRVPVRIAPVQHGWYVYQPATWAWASSPALSPSGSWSCGMLNGKMGVWEKVVGGGWHLLQYEEQLRISRGWMSFVFRLVLEHTHPLCFPELLIMIGLAADVLPKCRFTGLDQPARSQWPFGLSRLEDPCFGVTSAVHSQWPRRRHPSDVIRHR